MFDVHAAGRVPGGGGRRGEGGSGGEPQTGGALAATWTHHNRTSGRVRGDREAAVGSLFRSKDS
jgi:hypothetical protein